jgi:hypothetical protein
MEPIKSNRRIDYKKLEELLQKHWPDSTNLTVDQLASVCIVYDCEPEEVVELIKSWFETEN